jgi:hypothetical protein
VRLMTRRLRRRLPQARACAIVMARSDVTVRPGGPRVSSAAVLGRLATTMAISGRVGTPPCAVAPLVPTPIRPNPRHVLGCPPRKGPRTPVVTREADCRSASVPGNQRQTESGGAANSPESTPHLDGVERARALIAELLGDINAARGALSVLLGSARAAVRKLARGVHAERPQEAPPRALNRGLRAASGVGSLGAAPSAGTKRAEFEGCS